MQELNDGPDENLRLKVLFELRNVKAHNVEVAAHEGTVTLSGSVCSSSENEKAVAAAWAASGVTNVATLLTIES